MRKLNKINDKMKKFILLGLIKINVFIAVGQTQQYAMSNQTITGVCAGIFTDSNAGTFSSGGSGNYGNNENFVMTFCSGTSEPMTFMFSELVIKSGDFLRIYDGANTSAPLLQTISNTNASNLIVTSTGPCITFHFTSDNSGGLFSSNGNWKAGFFCGTIPNCTPGSSTTAADACANAPAICSLNGYCGNTSSYYTPDKPGNMCEDCPLFLGSLENNSWLRFAASSTTATFVVFVTTCTNSTGIQFGVYQGTNCNNFVLMTPQNWTSASSPMGPGSMSTIVATGLTPGQVYYIMIDGNAGDNCQYIIKAESGFILGADISDDVTICPGENATISISYTSSNPYISWTSQPNDPSLQGQIHNSTINVHPSTTTTYYAYIKDSSGFCVVDTTLSCTVTVRSPNDPNCYSPISCTINKTDATQCPSPPNNNNSCNGTANVIVTGSSGPFNYIWNDGNTSGYRNTLCAGTYTVTVSVPNSNTPSTSCSVTINGPNPPTITLTSSNSCPNGANGSINLTVTSGQPPYTYAWSNGQNTEDIYFLPAGTYHVTVTDNGRCKVSDSITVEEFPHYTITLTSSSNSVCPGNTTTITANGANTYAWSGQGLINNTGTVVQVKPPQTTTYTVTGTNSNGCTETATITINILPKPEISATANPSHICRGQTTTLTASGANTYIWTGGTTPNNSSTVSASPTNTTTYYVIGTNLDGCKDTTEVTVYIYNDPNVNFSVSGIGCSPVEAFMKNLTPDTIVETRWEISDGTIIQNVNEFSHTFYATNSPKTYGVKLWVKDNHGCTAEMTLPNSIMVYPIPIAEITVSSQTAYPGQEIDFKGGTNNGINMWYWNFGDNNQNFIPTSTPDISYSYNEIGTYSVTLIVENNGGCRDTTTINIEITGIQIPNVFTPDKDGKNENFVITNIEKLSDNHLLIFNRWGKKIFEAYNYKNDWNGENCPDGTYYYILKIGKDIAYQGNITILRNN